MRRFLATLGLFAALLGAASAVAQPLIVTPSFAAVFGHSGGVIQFPAPTPAPLASTFLGFDNISSANTTNNGLSVASGGSFPAVAPADWVWVQKFRYDDNAMAYSPLGSSAPITLAANCALVGCSGGSDRSLQVSNPFASATAARQNEILFSGKRSNSTNIWLPPAGLTGAQTGVDLVPGKYYCAVISQASGIVAVAANDNTGTPATGSPSVSTTVNNTASPGSANYYYAAATGTPAAQSNLFNTIGTALTATGAYANSTSGPFGETAMIRGTLANTAGTPSATALQHLCDGSMDLGTWITTYVTSPAVTSYYPLNNPNASPPTSFPSGTLTGFTPSFTTALSVIAGNSAAIIPASPIDPLACLTLNEKGPIDVAPLDAGQSGSGTGTIRVSGTINATSCGFAPSGVQGQIINIGTGLAESGWTNLTVTGSKYNGFISGIPGSLASVGNHRISVRLTNSPSYILAGQDPVAVGVSLLGEGQSQKSIFYAPGITGSGTGSQLAGNGKLTVMIDTLADNGNVPTNHGAGHVGLINIDAVNNPGGGSTSQLVGDGLVEEAQDLASALGVPIEETSLAKAGQSSNFWACDFAPQTSTLSGSGTGAYTSATVFTGSACAPGVANTGFLGTTFNTANNSVMTLLHGSVVKDAGGVTVATDNGAGTFTGTNVSAGGTINYLTGAISGLTFTGSQNSPLTLSWTSCQDTIFSTYSQQASYVGFCGWGDGVNSASGYVTKVLNEKVQPISVNIFEQVTADASAMASTNPPATNSSGYAQTWQANWRYVLEQRLATYPWYRGTEPIMVLGYARDAQDPRGNIAAGRQALLAMANLGGRYSYGGSYVDDLIQCVGTVLCIGPHEGPYLMGGRRMGRRAAARLCALQEQDTKCTPVAGSVFGSNPIPVGEPSITGAVRSGTTVTFTVSNLNAVVGGGTPALTNCGTSLSGGSSPPPLSTNTCSPPVTPVGTAVFGFSFGFAATAMFNWQGADWRNTPAALDDTKTSSCVIASATTITCTGTWFTTGLLWIYAADGPFQEAGSIGPLTVVGGSGYSGTTPFVATSTGGGCTTAATVTLVLTGGVISASRTTAGAACTSAPTIPITHFTGGTGASVTVNSVWTPQNDFDHVGQLLYDNSLGCGGTVSGVTYEPGCPVTPVMIPQGPLA